MNVLQDVIDRALRFLSEPIRHTNKRPTIKPILLSQIIQASIGPRHLAVEAQANEPTRPTAAGQAYYFTRVNGSGKTEVCVKLRGTTNAGEVIVLATET